MQKEKTFTSNCYLYRLTSKAFKTPVKYYKLFYIKRLILSVIDMQVIACKK